jgi:hypothetical protein
MSPHPRFLSVVAVACGGLLVWAWLARADIAAPEVHGNATPGAASVAPADAVVDAAVRPDETAGPGTTRTEASEPGGRELDAAVDVIRGIVVDESGAPVANAELSVDHPRIWTPSGRSDAAGAFAIARGDADTASRARVRCRHERYDEFVAWLRWGQTARVVLPSPIAVEVVVVDDHGALVEADNVHAEPADGRSSGNHSSCARDGAVWRANLRRGRYRITGTVPAPADATSIAPFTGELDGPFLPDPAAAAHYRRVAAGRPLIVSRPLVVVGPGPVRVQLVAMANGARRVCVVDAAGQPVAAASVQLVELGDGPALTASELYSYSELIALGAISREVGHWRTDERGEAELHGARSRAHRVRAEKDSHVSAVVDVTLDGSAPVVLTLLDAARGTGRVLAATQLAAAIAAGRCNQLIVETAGTPSAANGADRAVKGFRVERDGTFRFDGVSPGSCFFRVWGPSLLEAWSGPLPLAAGENAPVVLDFRGWRFVEVRLWARCDSGPLAGVALELADAAVPFASAAQHATTGSDGRATVWLRPARYTVRPGQATRREVVGLVDGMSAELDVPDSETAVEREIVVATGEVRLSFVDARGEPVPGLCVALQRGGGERAAPMLADGDGRMVLRRGAGTWSVAALVVPEWATASDSDPLAGGDARFVDIGTVSLRSGEVTNARFVVSQHLVR